MRGGGMVVSVGSIRPDPVYDARFTLVVHNTLRGAAGAAILNAELLAATGRIRGVESWVNELADIAVRMSRNARTYKPVSS